MPGLVSRLAPAADVCCLVLCVTFLAFAVAYAFPVASLGPPSDYEDEYLCSDERVVHSPRPGDATHGRERSEPW